MSVPKLRFKDGDWRDFPKWEFRSLQEVCERIMDGTHFSPKTKEGSRRYLTSKNIRNTGIDLTDCNYISEEEHQEIFKKCPVKLGDILLTKDGANTGNCCINNLQEEFSLLSSVAVLNGKDNVLNNFFLLQVLQSGQGINTINNVMAGQAISRITLEKINKFKFYFPELPEQTKIANFLTAVDEKITQLTQKCDLLAQYKKGVMQQIFSQELRFKDDDGRDFPKWEEKTLGQISNIKRGASPRPISDKKWFSNESSIGWVRISDVSSSNKYLVRTDQYLSKEGISKSRLVTKGNIIMSICATIGKPIYTNFDVCIHDGFVVFEQLQINHEFLYYYLMFIEKNWYQYGQPGSQVNLNSDIVSNETITIPDLKEQTQIANFLTAIDDKINNAQAQLAAVKQYKQGLLQQMFV
jgi:type I restriction enzyme, S subunit